MQIILANETLDIKINSIGAELKSILRRSDQKEFIWQGDPNIWASHAPVLFPIIGGLKEGVYHYQNQKYRVPKHGFIRYNESLEVMNYSKRKVSFLLTSSDATKKMYPFNFTFEIVFELVQNRILISHIIKNTGDVSMYFSVGGHPAFNCPLEDNESYEEYYIQLENGSGSPAYLLNGDGVITENTVSVFEDDKIRLTPTLFDKDALIFKNIKARKATLFHKNKGAVLSMNFPDFPDLGIWAKPKALFVCIEPWLGYADVEESNQKLDEKKGIQTLPPGGIHTSSYDIEIL